MDRLDVIKQEREESLEESKEMWEGVRHSVESISDSIAVLNRSVVTLSHAMGLFLNNLEKQKNNAIA